MRHVSPLETLPREIGLSNEEWRHVLPAADMLEDRDLVIDRSGPLGALLVGGRSGAALHVVHGPLDAAMRPIYQAVCRRAPALRLVAISAAQRRSAPEPPFAGVCHNGVDLEGPRKIDDWWADAVRKPSESPPAT